VKLQWASVIPKKHRHVWVARVPAPTDTDLKPWWECRLCGYPQDPLLVRRGRNNRRRGNAIEREVAHKLGLKRVGMYGGPDDIGSAAQPCIGQVKSGKSFPERLYRWLKALPSNANQTPILVMTDAPGPGIRRRALVIVTLEDWIALHGPIGAEDD
jgi:hypothetical protein